MTLDPHPVLLLCISIANWMGKRKTHESESPFQTNTKCPKDNHLKLGKLRHDLWVTTLKQQNLVKLIHDEIPDSFDHTTRNLLHSTTNLLFDDKENCSAATLTTLSEEDFYTRRVS